MRSSAQESVEDRPLLMLPSSIALSWLPSLHSNGRYSDSTDLDGELALGEVGGALLGLVGDSAGLLLGQSPADGTGLLRAEVEGSVLLVLVEQAELGALLGVDDGKDASDRLADVVAVERKFSPVSPLGFSFFDRRFLQLTRNRTGGIKRTSCSACCRKRRSSGCGADRARS